MTLREAMRRSTVLAGCSPEDARVARSVLATPNDKDNFVKRYLTLSKSGKSKEVQAAALEITLEEYVSLSRFLKALGYGCEGANPLLEQDKPLVKFWYNKGLKSVVKMAADLRCSALSILEYLDEEGLKVKRGGVYMRVFYPLNLYLMLAQVDVHEISQTMGSLICRAVDGLPKANREVVLSFCKDLTPMDALSDTQRDLLGVSFDAMRKVLHLGNYLGCEYATVEAKRKYSDYKKLAKDEAITLQKFQQLHFLQVTDLRLSDGLLKALKEGNVKYLTDIGMIKSCTLSHKQKLELDHVKRKYGLKAL